MFDTAEHQGFFLAERQDASRCSHDNVRVLGFEYFSVLLDVDTSIEDSSLDGWEVLGEAFVLVGDLKGQLTRVTQDEYLHIGRLFFR